MSKDMTFDDLRGFLEKVEEIGELRHIYGADWKLEVGAITEVAGTSVSMPAILFDNIKGYPPGFRILTNALRKHTRAALAVGLPYDLPPLELVRLWKERLDKMKPVKPAYVDSGPVEENVQLDSEIDLNKFPTPIWHAKDGGRYIGTADLIVTKDEDSTWVNMGVYRVQIVDKDKVTLFIEPGHHGRIMAEQYWAKGKSCPVAICCGEDPALWVAASFPLPYGVSEYDFAATLKEGNPVKVVESKLTGIPIPASAEIVIEGEFMPPSVMTVTEGPFGEWTGYYGSGSRPCPVVKVTRVMYRTNPILLGAPPFRGPVIGLSRDAVSIWNALEDAGVPNVKGVWNHLGQGLFVVVSIKQSYPGHAKQAGLVALGSRGGNYHGTFVVVVDDDVDPSNLEEVVWAMTTRCEPGQAIDIIRDCWTGYLDPKVSTERKQIGDLTNTRAIINACRPFHLIDKYPEVSAIDFETRRQTVTKWGKELGI